MGAEVEVGMEKGAWMGLEVVEVEEMGVEEEIEIKGGVGMEEGLEVGIMVGEKEELIESKDRLAQVEEIGMGKMYLELRCVMSETMAMDLKKQSTYLLQAWCSNSLLQTRKKTTMVRNPETFHLVGGAGYLDNISLGIPRYSCAYKCRSMVRKIQLVLVDEEGNTSVDRL